MAEDLATEGELPRTAEATLEITVKDVNDHAPRFVRKKYQGFMNKDLTKLRNDLQVEANDRKK